MKKFFIKIFVFSFQNSFQEALKTFPRLNKKIFYILSAKSFFSHFETKTKKNEKFFWNIITYISNNIIGTGRWDAADADASLAFQKILLDFFFLFLRV